MIIIHDRAVSAVASRRLNRNIVMSDSDEEPINFFADIEGLDLNTPFIKEKSNVNFTSSTLGDSVHQPIVKKAELLNKKFSESVSTRATSIENRSLDSLRLIETSPLSVLGLFNTVHRY
jgi:hypothetical protein